LDFERIFADEERQLHGAVMSPKPRSRSPWIKESALGLLAAEMTARVGKDPSGSYSDVTSDLGVSFYERIDAPASSAQKAVLKNISPERRASRELAGEAIEAKLTKAPGNDQPIGGIKVVAKSGWFAARPSGTEDVYKILRGEISQQ
jgi:phosphoglucomutase